jgi:hypothetical protein
MSASTFDEGSLPTYCVEKLGVKAIFCIGNFFSCILERLMADV